ncbi:MAG: amino acid transporter permease [Nevskia sp.]|nr:amino acid transporter permease [Nevskia sp.]
MAIASTVRRAYAWHGVSVLILLAFAASLYFASKQIDYTWRWQRLPQYLISTGGAEVPAPFDGTVKIEADGKTLSITPLLGGGAAQKVTDVEVPQVGDGEVVFKGNTLGKKPGISAGPLLIGLWLTLRISAVSLVFALILGVLAGLGRVSQNPAARDVSSFYVEVIRGTPLLVQLFIAYFFFAPTLHLSAFSAGVFGLSVFTGAYIAEIVRAGIQAVPKGQTEAAQSLGLSGLQNLRHVILPQAIKKILPPLAGQFINLIKDSSLVSVMALTDLTKAGREVVSSTFSPFEVWFTVALMYLILTGGLSLVVNRFEKRLSRHD